MYFPQFGVTLFLQLLIIQLSYGSVVITGSINDLKKPCSSIDLKVNGLQSQLSLNGEDCNSNCETKLNESKTTVSFSIDKLVTRYYDPKNEIFSTPMFTTKDGDRVYFKVEKIASASDPLLNIYPCFPVEGLPNDTRPYLKYDTIEIFTGNRSIDYGFWRYIDIEFGEKFQPARECLDRWPTQIPMNRLLNAMVNQTVKVTATFIPLNLDCLSYLSDNGEFLWKMDQFSARQSEEGGKRSIANQRSGSFYTSPKGYRLQAYFSVSNRTSDQIITEFSFLQGKYDMSLSQKPSFRFTCTLLDATDTKDKQNLERTELYKNSSYNGTVYGRFGFQEFPKILPLRYFGPNTTVVFKVAVKII